MDWSEHHIKLQPLSRQLYEAVNRSEWDTAIVLSEQLLTVVARVHAETYARQMLGKHR